MYCPPTSSSLPAQSRVARVAVTARCEKPPEHHFDGASALAQLTAIADRDHGPIPWQ